MGWRDMEWEAKLFLGVIAALLVAAVYLAIQEQKDWEAFSAAHHCKVVGKQKGHVSTGFGVGVTGGGQVGSVVTTSSTPDTTGYLCDDGVTYWR